MSTISENWSYARDKLASGLSYAAVSRATGINEITLREALRGYAPAPRPAPAVTVNNLAKGHAAIMGAPAHDLATLLTTAFSRLVVISPRLAADFLASVAPPPEPQPSPPPSPKPLPRPMTKDRLWEVVDAVAKRHGLKRSDLLSDSREAKYVHARQEAFWRLRQLDPQPSFPAIGRLMKRDHTTVLHGVRAHERRMGWAE